MLSGPANFASANAEITTSAPDKYQVSNVQLPYSGNYAFYSEAKYGTVYRGYLYYSGEFNKKHYYQGYIYRTGITYPTPMIAQPLRH